MFREEDFEPDGLFGSRGVSREAAEGAFFPYEQGDWEAALKAEPRYSSQRLRRLASRAPGMVMRRWPVPGADPEIIAELRPKWPVWTGKRSHWRGSAAVTSHTHRNMSERERLEHVRPHRSPTTADDVRKGCTPEDFAWLSTEFEGFELTCGGDHGGDDFDVRLRHPHANVAKYLFPANLRELGVATGTPHTHLDENYWTEDRLRTHLFYEHGGVEAARAARKEFGGIGRDLDPWDRLGTALWHSVRDQWPGGPHGSPMPDCDALHPHLEEFETTKYAQRLSIHPLSLPRLDESRGRVCFALEGCLKEASLVSAGEVTFSCPSVSLWDAKELETFAVEHLVGRTVLVICDSDWERADDNSVLYQTLNARDALRSFGANAVMAAPPMGGDACQHVNKKHGVDDFLAEGPCHGEVDDLVTYDREVPFLAGAWLADTGRRVDWVRRTDLVLKWLIVRAADNGEVRFTASSAAKSLRHQYETAEGHASSLDARIQKVTRSVRDLVAEDILQELVPLSVNSRMKYRRRYQDYQGTFRIVPLALRATTARGLARDI